MLYPNLPVFEYIYKYVYRLLICIITTVLFDISLEKIFRVFLFMKT